MIDPTFDLRTTSHEAASPSRIACATAILRSEISFLSLFIVNTMNSIISLFLNFIK